jgi:hypothetical protein
MSNEDGRRPHSTAIGLAAVLVLALAIRIAVLSQGPYLIHPDETFQYFEYAHYFVYHTGVMPWEFFSGIRSYVLPGLIAGVIEIERSLGGSSPAIYVYAVKALAILLSLSVVYVGFRAGERTFGLAGGLFTGAVCALWFELIFFAPAILTEVLASHVALLGLYLLDRNHAAARSPAISGALLGLSVCLRFHYGPALAIAVLWALWRDSKVLLTVILWAGLVVLLLVGVLDTITLGLPFQSVWYNFWVNAGENASSDFGTSPWFSYALWISQSWTPLLWPFAVLALIGIFRWPALGIASIGVILSQSLFGHKEYRFVYFTLMTAPIFIGLGAAQVFALCRRAVDGVTIAIAQTALIVVLGLASYIVGTTGALADRFDTDRNGFAAFMAAHDLKDICGLGVKGFHWAETGGGYSYFNRAVPLYYSTGQIGRIKIVLNGKQIDQYAFDEYKTAGEYAPADFMSHTDRFNYLILPAGQSVTGFQEVACFAKPNGGLPVCLEHRAGPCI